MTNISLLLTIILLVFGVMGVTLFSQYVPDQFGSLQVREQCRTMQCQAGVEGGKRTAGRGGRALQLKLSTATLAVRISSDVCH